MAKKGFTKFYGGLYACTACEIPTWFKKKADIRAHLIKTHNFKTSAASELLKRWGY